MEVAQNLAEVQVLTQNFMKKHTAQFADNEFKVLLMLKIHGQCSPKLMIAKIGILKTNLAFVLKKLALQGLVGSVGSEVDGRAKTYFLTESGHEALGRCLDSARKDLGDVITEDFFYAVKVITSVLNRKFEGGKQKNEIL